MIGVLLTLLFDEICLPGVTKIVRSTLWVLTNCCYRSRCLDSALTKVCFVSWKLILWQYFIFTFSHHPALTTAHYRERKPSLPVGAHTSNIYFCGVSWPPWLVRSRPWVFLKLTSSAQFRIRNLLRWFPLPSIAFLIRLGIFARSSMTKSTEGWGRLGMMRLPYVPPRLIPFLGCWRSHLSLSPIVERFCPPTLH